MTTLLANLTSHKQSFTKSVAIVGLVGLAASLPWWLLPSGFWVSAVTTSYIFGIAAVAWVLIGGIAGQATFGNSVFFGIGAYSAAIADQHLHIGPYGGLGIAIGIGIIASLLIGTISFRTVGVYFALITFTTSLVFELFANYFASLTSGAIGISETSAPAGLSNFNFTSADTWYLVTIAIFALVTIAALAISKSWTGTVWRALRDAEDAATACGLYVRWLKNGALLWSAVFTALAGWLYFQFLGFIDPSSAFGLTVATLIPVMALFGGSRRIAGGVVGAIVLIPLEQFAGSTQAASLPSGLGLIIFATIVIIILWIDPRGLVNLVLRGVGYVTVHARQILQGTTRTEEPTKEENRMTVPGSKNETIYKANTRAKFPVENDRAKIIETVTGETDELR